jgi:hypothetical protein
MLASTAGQCTSTQARRQIPSTVAMAITPTIAKAANTAIYEIVAHRWGRRRVRVTGQVKASAQSRKAAKNLGSPELFCDVA